MDQMSVKNGLEDIFCEKDILFKQMKRIAQVFLMMGSIKRLGGHHGI